MHKYLCVYINLFVCLCVSVCVERNSLIIGKGISSRATPPPPRSKLISDRVAISHWPPKPPSSPNPPATNPALHMSKRNWCSPGPDYTLADSIVWIRVHEKATGSTRLSRGCTLSCRSPRPRIPFSPSLALPHSPRPACITHAASCD